MVFENKTKALILGLGKSGLSAAKLALKKGYKVIAIDDADNEALAKQKIELSELGALVHLGYKEAVLPECGIIISSPGVGPKSRLGKLSIAAKVPIINETEFAWRYCVTPIIAITGTNGKTTATEFCTYILGNIGKSVIAAGNIGYPLSELLLSEKIYDYIVLEISSFQLHYCKDFCPHIAIILNIESDHIDWHGSFENYRDDKLKITANQNETNFLIINKNLEYLVSKFKSKILTFSTVSKASDYFLDSGVIHRNGDKVCSYNQLGVMGSSPHNLENAMAVIGACEALGFSFEKIIKGSLDFKVGEHRLELVLEKDGIFFINDSKSTNPLSMMAALKTVGGHKNVCLIAGGLDKEMDFTPILEYSDLIKKIFIIGKSKTKLENLFSQVLNYSSCSTFEEAVYSACDSAGYGDVVLLSPGFASMDMFKNYIERGNVFKNLIKRRYLDEKGRQEN